MVAVLHAAPLPDAPLAVGAWLDGLRSTYGDDGARTIAAAFETLREAGDDAHTPEGEPVVERALGTATILAGLRFARRCFIRCPHSVGSTPKRWRARTARRSHRSSPASCG